MKTVLGNTIEGSYNAETLQAGFDRDGYVAIRGFLNQQEVESLRVNLDRFIAEIVPTMPREEVFYEQLGAKDSLKQIQSLHKHGGYFHDLFTVGRFPELTRTLLRDEIVPVNTQYFNKPPGVGQPTPPHQDGYYFMLNPCEAVTMWLALDDVDEENGCVRYVRGSHREGMRPHSRTQTLGFSQGISDYPQPRDLEQETAFPAKPGDLLVHHALTIHRADGNRSLHRSRRALGLIYYAASVRVDEESVAAYQTSLNQQLVAQGKV